MPLQIPNLDDRRFQQLVDESLARIPVHTPEWTNFNQSDPGVTLIQAFAFLTETLLYRCNQIPERNHKKFLQLIGVPLLPAASAEGFVTFTNERGPLETLTLSDDLEVRAGQVPFRIERGLDVLPVEALVYFKHIRTAPPQEQKEARAAYDTELEHYRQLYTALLEEQAPANLQLYEPELLSARGNEGVDLGAETVDQILWVALMLRESDKPPTDAIRKKARQAIAGKTLSLGVVPQIDPDVAERRLPPGGDSGARSASLTVELPSVPANGQLPDSGQPTYKPLASVPAPIEPVVLDIPLPDESQLGLWNNLDPLQPGTNDLPPPLNDTALEDRLLTWLRLNWGSGTHARVQWAGINCATVSQRARVLNEVLTTAATGEPDQEFILANNPVLPDSVRLTVIPQVNQAIEWTLINDLMSAGPEVPTSDPRYPPGVAAPKPGPSKVFALDPEAGKIRFGDGFRGARPPLGAAIRIDYDYGQGAAGNVGDSSINNAPALPAGLKVTNPIRTWGGTDAETTAEGEKQITRFLQNRDRLVNAADFETITMRTPGVEIGRVDVLPAYNPTLSRHEPGNSPGAVTLMLIPKYSTKRPDAPMPEDVFLRAVCEYLDPRRLVTTELFLTGPEYQPIFISVGIVVVSGRNVSSAVVRESVATRLKQFLAPINGETAGKLSDSTLALAPAESIPGLKGWPLGRPVLRGELEAEVARVPGVSMVTKLILTDALTPNPDPDGLDQVDMRGLQLPRIDGIQVRVGDPVPISQVRGDSQGGLPSPPKVVPVPAIPKEC